MKRFIYQTGILDYMSELALPEPGSNRGYSPEHILESFWLGIWTGASRYIHCDWLRYDTTLHSIFGWDKMPSLTHCLPCSLSGQGIATARR